MSQRLGLDLDAIACLIGATLPHRRWRLAGRGVVSEAAPESSSFLFDAQTGLWGGRWAGSCEIGLSPSSTAFAVALRSIHDPSLRRNLAKGPGDSKRK